jgi:hypothetical protein
MGNKLEIITPKLKTFIQNQKIFFVGTAAAEGKINVSPKGTDSFRVIDEKKIVWLNLTGSGNETAAHLLKNNRMTIMFCAFEGAPMILRLYGEAKIYHQRDLEFHAFSKLFKQNVGARQIIEMEVNLVQTSCGFGVPLMDFKEARTQLDTWAEDLGKEKIETYWKNKNTVSLDGFETHILDE